MLSFLVSLSPRSERISKGKENFSLKNLLSSGESPLIPIIMVFFSVNSWILSRNPFPSMVHPGVSAFGNHHKISFFPE